MEVKRQAFETLPVSLYEHEILNTTHNTIAWFIGVKYMDGHKINCEVYCSQNY